MYWLICLMRINEGPATVAAVSESLWFTSRSDAELAVFKLRADGWTVTRLYDV